MISLVKESKLAPSRVIEQAVAFFGPGGWGLDVVERAECCARFEGGGGHVFVQATDREKGKCSEVAVVSRVWEHAAKAVQRGEVIGRVVEVHLDVLVLLDDDPARLEVFVGHIGRTNASICPRPPVPLGTPIAELSVPPARLALVELDGAGKA